MKSFADARDYLNAHSLARSRASSGSSCDETIILPLKIRFASHFRIKAGRARTDQISFA